MDGSAYDDANCVLATCTDLIDRATVGRLRIAAPVLRRASGDTSGGVGYSTAAATVTKATGGQVVFEPRYQLTRSQVRDLVVAGRAIGISIDASETRYTPYRTGTFTGGHTVYVNHYHWDATQQRAEYTVEDPGTTAAGYLDWPADLLYRAAEKRGGGRINVLVSRDTEGTWRTCREAAGVHAFASSSSTKKGTTIVTHKYAVLDTSNGGEWPRTDGVSNGWHRIKYGTGAGFVRGEALR